MNKDNTKKGENESLELSSFDEKILMLAIPAIGYAASYCYECGFCNYFKIPNNLITLNVGNIAQALYGILLAILFFLIYVRSYVDLHTKYKNSFIGLQKTIYIFLFWVSIIILIISYALGEFSWALISLISFSVAVGVLNKHFKAESRESNTVKEDNFDKKEDSGNKENKGFDKLNFFDKFDFGVSIIAILVSILMFFSYFAGVRSAKQQVVFSVFKEIPEQFIIKIYGDNLIYGTYNPKTKHIKTSIKIIKISNLTPIELEEKTIGPLKLEPSNSDIKSSSFSNFYHKITVFFDDKKFKPSIKDSPRALNNLQYGFAKTNRCNSCHTKADIEKFAPTLFK